MLVSYYFLKNLSAHDLCQRVALSRDLLALYLKSDIELFFCGLFIGDKRCIHHWDRESKLESI